MINVFAWAAVTIDRGGGEGGLYKQKGMAHSSGGLKVAEQVGSSQGSLPGVQTLSLEKALIPT